MHEWSMKAWSAQTQKKTRTEIIADWHKPHLFLLPSLVISVSECLSSNVWNRKFLGKEKEKQTDHEKRNWHEPFSSTSIELQLNSTLNTTRWVEWVEYGRPAYCFVSLQSIALIFTQDRRRMIMITWPTCMLIRSTMNAKKEGEEKKRKKERKREKKKKNRSLLLFWTSIILDSTSSCHSMGTRYYPICRNFLSSGGERTGAEGTRGKRKRKKGSVIAMILIRINRISSCVKTNEETVSKRNNSTCNWWKNKKEEWAKYDYLSKG